MKARWSMSGLQSGIAVMGIVSMNPYLLWGYHQKIAYAAASVLIVASAAGCFRALVFTRERLALSALAAGFLIYLSLLPKVGGGTTRWFLLIPFTAALLHLGRNDLSGAFEKFYALFVLSLLPGIAVWLWLAAGLPVTLEVIYPPAGIEQRGPTPYFKGPGMIFLPTNGMLLPHGGSVFRLCGPYDEPGTVGTIAALTLAAARYRMDTRGAVAFAAGVMSLSIAFAVLAVVGLLALALAQRRPVLAGLALVAAGAGAVPALGLTALPNDPERRTSITLVVPKNHPHWHEDGSGRAFALSEDARIRQQERLDNRALPALRGLFAEYRAASPATLLFGVASNASNVHAGDSASWLQIPVNYGAVGFAWAFVLFAAPIVGLFRRRQLDFGTAVFCLLFLMSFYQRPVIWLPVPLLIYAAGLAAARRSA